MNETDKAWLAGFMEGDGWVSWKARKGKRRVPTLAIVNTDPTLVNHCEKLMGAKRQIQDLPNRKAMMRIVISGIKAFNLIKELEPYIVSATKGAIAREILRTYVPKDFRFGRRVPEEVLANT